MVYFSADKRHTCRRHCQKSMQKRGQKLPSSFDRLKTERGITESLKATDPLRWVQKMLVAEEATKKWSATPCFFCKVFENKLCHRTAADVAVVSEHNFYSHYHTTTGAESPASPARQCLFGVTWQPETNGLFTNSTGSEDRIPCNFKQPQSLWWKIIFPRTAPLWKKFART